jgi:porin
MRPVVNLTKQPLNSLGRRAQLRAAVLAVACSAAAVQADEANPPDTLTGAWTSRMKLEAKGINPFAVWTTEGWANTMGGVHRGGWWNNLLEFGVELDTAKLGWWEGGRFLVEAHWVCNLRNDETLEDMTGAFNPASGIMAAEHFRVFNLFYQHVWGEDRVVVKAGQIAVDDDFMLSDYTGLFLNSAFGAMPSQVGTPLATHYFGSAAFPIFPVAAPGLFVRVRPVDSFFSQLGLYYGTPGLDERNNYGFDWASQSSPELGLFWESGFSYQLANRPAATRLGLSYHTGPMDDYAASLKGGTDSNRPDSPDFYLVQDWAVCVDAEGKPRLGAFTRVGITPHEGLHIVTLYADAGLNWFSPISSRPDDVAGAAVSHTAFGHDFRTSTVDGPADTETTVELTYRAQVTPWFALQGDAQILFNPARNPDSGNRETALLLGLRGEVSF